MTKIAIAARYADDTPYGKGAVTVRLVDAGAGAPLPGGLSVVQQYVSLDPDGEAIVTLTPTADVGTPDTYYALTVVGSSPTVVRYIEVPAANGSGDEEIPYDWDDEAIQRLVPDPPSSIPAAGAGTVGQVLTVVDNGDGKKYSLEDAAGGGGGGADHVVGLFIESIADSDTDIVLYGSGASIPRSSLTGAPVLVVSGTNFGLQTVTASGPLTAGATLAPGDIIVALGGGQGYAAVATTSDGTTVDAVTIGATAAEVATVAADAADAAADATDALADAAAAATVAHAAVGLAVDGEAALRSVVDGPVTVRQFEFCAPWGDDHDAKSWSTPKPASFSGGIWCEAPVTVTGDGLPASPTDGDKVWQEIWTQTADGLGAWDGFEGAVESEWSAAIGQWIHRMFWEHTATGGTAETYQITSDDGDAAWRFTERIPTRVAVWIDFTDGTNSHGYLLREAPEGSIGDLTAASRHWRIIRHKVDAPTDIDPGITDPWYIGAGNGGLLVPEAIIRNGGPSGTILASPNAAAAWAEADGAFDDAQANTWTPGPDAATQAGTNTTAATEAYVDAKVEDAIADGVTTKAPSQNAVHDALALKVPTSRTLNGVTLAADHTLPNLLTQPPPVHAALQWSAANATPSILFNSARVLGQRISTANSATANGYLEWEVFFDSGTWTLIGYGDRASVCGTSTIKLEGTTLGTWNQYNATTDIGASATFAGIVVSTPGVYTLRAENTSAGSGGGYDIQISAWQQRRTA